MRLFFARAHRPVALALVAALSGCSAISDFDYSFQASQRADGGDSDGGNSDGGNGLDASQPPADAQVPPPDSGTTVGADAAADASTTDAGVCLTCCQITEISELTCTGGYDEDCDGKVDCMDTDCRQAAACCPNPAPESGDTACTDKMDNDCDGILDCQEMSCAGVYGCTCKVSGPEDGSRPASCTDMNDNDCDHLVDCDEKACAIAPACCTKESSTETGAQCTDGKNNDCDADGADCADPDCRMSSDAGSVGTETGAACKNGKDDDCDGLVDCKDDDCRDVMLCCVPTPGQESVETSCGDGLNNDCDASGADCYDPDCKMDKNCCVAPAGGESTDALCSNRADDDCDGLVDCKDPQCNRTVHCCPSYLSANGQTLQTTETSCTDAYDNDCDGALNCADSDCSVLKSCSIIIRPPITTDPVPVTTASQ